MPQPAIAAETPQLGKYRLIKKIASGGMAEIYVGQIDLLDCQKFVVVKRVLPELAKDPLFLQMFLDEARLAVTLDHTNIVRTYDVGSIGNQHYIAMEYLHGKDVGAILRTACRQRIRLPLQHAIHIAIGITSGLHYAHEKRSLDGNPLGIVHRDVTPQNVFVTYDGGIKLVDFGIAKSANKLTKTRCGTLMGKIRYMSPEQARVEPLDRRTDVFAAGILLFELTTGRRLFRGKSDYEILKRIVDSPIPRPSTLRDGYAPDLETIVMKALAKDPADRYQTAQAMQADLESLACRHRLPISTIGLSSFMYDLFGETVEAWRAAQIAGADLAELIPEKTPGVDAVDEDSYRAASMLCEVSADEDHDEADPVTASVVIDMDLDDDALAEADPTESKPLPPAFAASRRTSRPKLALAAATLVCAAGVTGLGWWQSQLGDEPARVAAAESAPTAVSSSLPVEDASRATRQAVVPAPEPAAAAADDAEATSSAEAAGDDVMTFTVAEEDKLIANGPAADAPDDAERERRAERRRARREARRAAKRAERESKRTESELEPAVEAAPKPRPASPDATAMGELRIASTPSCELFVDGRSVGSTPVVGLRLSAKSHTIHLVNSRFGIDERYNVVVKADGVTKKRYRFDVE